MTRKRVSKKKHKNLPWQFAKIQNTTKVKELLNLWINGHNEHILSVPRRDLSRENVPYGLPFSNGFGICLNGSGYPFKKKLSSVRTTWAIRLKKVVIRSNCLGCPFEKSCHLFERLGISVWKNCYPLERLGLSVRKRICRPFERLKLSVQR